MIQRFLGYWDANPATPIPLSPEDSGALYVEMMGGPERIMARGKELHDEGKYPHASEILNRLVQAEPDNQAAKDLLADVFEQIGYQKENPGLTLTIDRSDLEQVMMGLKTLMATIEDGTAQVEGDPSVLVSIGSAMVDFDPRFPNA